MPPGNDKIISDHRFYPIQEVTLYKYIARAAQGKFNTTNPHKKISSHSHNLV